MFDVFVVQPVLDPLVHLDQHLLLAVWIMQIGVQILQTSVMIQIIRILEIHAVQHVLVKLDPQVPLALLVLAV